MTNVTFSGNIRNDNPADSALSNINVDLYQWDRNTNPPSWTHRLSTYTSAIVGTLGNYSFTVTFDSGKYKIEPTSDTIAFEPEFIITNAKHDHKAFDFIGTTLSNSNQPNQIVDPPMIKDVLSACLASVDDWYKTDANWDTTRKRVIKTVKDLLWRNGDPGFLTASVPLETMQPELHIQDARDHVFEWQRQQIAMIEQAAQEQFAEIARIEREQGKENEEEGADFVRTSRYSYVACTVCRDRYCTPGTSYYLNYPALVSCMNNPPCS